jgi:hypothetical protein
VSNRFPETSMSRLVLSPELLDQLASLSEPAVLYHPTGKRLGVFTPASRASLYEGVDASASRDELQERLNEPARVTHDEVMRLVREQL